MTDFEYAIATVALVTLAVGILIGFAAGKARSNERARIAEAAGYRSGLAQAPRDTYGAGHRAGYFGGYRQGVLDSADCEIEPEVNLYAPMRAADVRLSE